jgi:hypothetical protein
MLDLDSFLVSLYVLVDDWWKLKHSSEPPRAGRPALLTATPRSSPWLFRSPVVVPLQKRARFLALCSCTSAPLLPEPLFPKPIQPQGALCGARFASLPACSGPNALWRLGGLPYPGHHSHPGHREGKSFSQRAVCRAGHLREERLQDRVGLRVLKVALSVSPEGVISAPSGWRRQPPTSAP